MAGKTLDIEEMLDPDEMGLAIANMYQEWDILRQVKKTQWEEIQRYIYSTDTTTTTNAQLPWKNKTTLPKLCQIRDNLYANYIASLFPKTDFVEWQGANLDEQTKEQADVMEAWTSYFTSNPANRETLYKMVLDYIDYGNVFGIVEWRSDQQVKGTTMLTGYVGPSFVRVSPYDIVFNPIAPSFEKSPKIIRSIMTIGELKKSLNTLTDNFEETQAAFDYLKDVRIRTAQYSGNFKEKSALYKVDGFTSFEIYLRSNYVEVLTFYGDYYDAVKDRLYENAVITVADRNKILGVRENTEVKIRSLGWRYRQDNVWAMGPLENLVGMQYRIDHLENLKADVFDLIAAPPLKIKGLVEDFQWAPFARIYVGDDGDVEVLSPDVNALSANLEIGNLENKMEEYAGSPKEAAGFRTPGEKTAYEVQRLENAANRIFYSKTRQFEELFLEPLLNDAMSLSRLNMTSQVNVRVFNDQNNAVAFLSIDRDKLAGLGTIKPVAARNFADKAQKVQNVTNFFASAVGADPEMKAHFSTIGIAKMFEELLDIEGYKVVKPYVRIFEQQQAQNYINSGQEQIANQAMQTGGATPSDFSQSANGLAQGL